MTAPPSILPLVLDGLVFAVAGRPLIKSITCRLERGPRTVILGPNGAGKSLLLRLCHGLLTPTAGTVSWAGAAAGGRDAISRAQAMVFQRPVMLRRSVAANIAYPLALRGLGRRDRRHRIAEALEVSGLKRFSDSWARVLSVGEQQKLALARAWALAPQILFLDEPTASLDPAATAKVEEIILAIDARGTKIVMTTHDLHQARRLGDEVVFLHRGRLVERAPADQFFASPQTEEAAAFLAGRLSTKRLKRGSP